MYRRVLLCALAGGLLVGGPAAAQTAKPWLHIHVVESGGDARKVNVNVPFSLAEAALEMAPSDVIRQGRLKLQQKDLSVEKLRRMWQELRGAGDHEFVTVEEKNQTVRLARQGEKLRIHVTGRGAKTENVQVEIPVPVVDALLSGEGDELNIEAALTRLKDQRGDIVTVDDGKSQVRIWIDERS